MVIFYQPVSTGSFITARTAYNHRIFKLMVKSQAGRLVQSAVTAQSTPRWQRAPLTMAHGSIKKSLASSTADGWAGVPSPCWFADNLVTHLKLLSFRTKVPL